MSLGKLGKVAIFQGVNLQGDDRRCWPSWLPLVTTAESYQTDGAVMSIKRAEV